MIDVYVTRDKILTKGFVVIKRAYSLNCFCPTSPGINNCRFPNKCPNKKRTKKAPDNDAIVFLKMVDVYDENTRNLRFANFNYNLDTDKSSAKYSICKSWNSLPFNLKSEQPDDFLEELKQYFNVSNDEECQVEKCWLCGHD